MKIRKTLIISESIVTEGGMEAQTPVSRFAGIGIIENPFAGRAVAELDALFQIGHDLGALLMEGIMRQVARPVVSYGKAAVVGVNGDLEHGHALLHPMLGKAMRGPLGGGEALIPSAGKVAAAGATLDIPLGHKDDAWSFDHFDAMTVCVPDAPRPNEILMAVAVADGGRPAPRVGRARAAV